MLIGAGIVMLMTNKSTAVGSAMEKGNEGLRHAATAIGSVGSKLATAAADGYAATRGATGSALDTVKDAAGKVSSTASQATDAAGSAYENAKETLAKGRNKVCTRSTMPRNGSPTRRPGSRALPRSNPSSW